MLINVSGGEGICGPGPQPYLYDQKKQGKGDRRGEVGGNGTGQDTGCES